MPARTGARAHRCIRARPTNRGPESTVGGARATFAAVTSLSAAHRLDLDGDLVVIASELFYRLGQAEFGVPGLIAIESVGPFVPVRAVGPFMMIHDSYWQPGFGIGHHPHRTNERLFYILRGRVEHDDALNGIKGVMEEGDLGRLTEGLKGMYHQEWNGAPGVVTHAFILVYHPDTEPPIPTAEFVPLRAADRTALREAPGVVTHQLVGPESSFRVNLSTLRLFADSSLVAGAELPLRMGADEGLLLYPIEGRVVVEASYGRRLEVDSEGSSHGEGPQGMVLAWSGPEGRQLVVHAPERGARVIRVGFARGEQDLVVGDR